MTSTTAKRILVVEDEFYIAADIARSLTEAGMVVAGPFASSEEAARATIHGRLDAAVLDIKLQLETTFKLAHDLSTRGVPVVFYTGYAADRVPAALAGIPLIEKPADPGYLVAAVQSLLLRERVGGAGGDGHTAGPRHV